MKRHMIDTLEANGVPQGLLTTKDLNVEIFEKAERAWDEKGKPESERVNQGEMEAIATVERVEGATETARTLKERGYKLAILTRSHNAYAVEALKKIGACEYFDLIIGRNETPKPKPYAEAMEHTAELMGRGRPPPGHDERSQRGVPLRRGPHGKKGRRIMGGPEAGGPLRQHQRCPGLLGRPLNIDPT
jgi:beta-phosphoglucomutase-like phosphatase (HAD superfamily)